MALASLNGANLLRADLRAANLSAAKLNNANLEGANLQEAKMSLASLEGANLKGAILYNADLHFTNLSKADLTDANLENARLIETNLEDAKLQGCSIWGISVWAVQLERAIQSDLVMTHLKITDPYNPERITVDNIEVAQFIYLLLNNNKIRQVIDTITSKIVLILGRFTPERKKILDALRDQLRHYNYSPVVFDFEKPSSRDFTETVRTLAHMSKFIIADLTDPSSIPQELQAIVPDLAVPVQPLLEESKREYAMFVDFHKYHWVLPTYIYKNQATLLASLKAEIIDLAEEKVKEIALEKAMALKSGKKRT